MNPYTKRSLIHLILSAVTIILGLVVFILISNSITQMLDKPVDEDAAFDAMLEPGTSLYFAVSGRVLQLHFDEDGVLSCVILRESMPERLY